MSYVSDFKSSPFGLFVTPSTSTNYSGTATIPSSGYTGTGLNGIPDYSLDALIGSKWQTADGRTLTLVSNGAAALTYGILVQSAAEVTAFEKLAMTVPTAYPAKAGSYQVLVTCGATKLDINEFAGGFLIVDSGTGIGQCLQIASHQAAIATTGKFVVTLADPLQLTLDATSTITLVKNLAKNVIITPATTATGAPVGVTLYKVPAATLPTYDGTSGALVTAGTPVYAFVVSHGFVACLVDATVTNVGYPVGVSITVPGAIGVATLTTVPQIGVSAQTFTAAHTGAATIFL